MAELRIGCHLSAADGYLHMARDAETIGANTFAFFTRNPRGGKSKKLDAEDVKRFLEEAEKNDISSLVAHAPYTMNPCSAKENVREFAHIAMKEDLERMEHTPGNYYNFHPGSHTGLGKEKGIELIAGLLNEVIRPDQDTTVLLETMAGKGTEIGGRFEDLAQIIERTELKDKVGVCFDTCHVSDAGYDIMTDLDGVLAEFDRVIGIAYLKALHINDSKNQPGTHKDRHAKIGEGTLGIGTFRKIVTHPVLSGLPMILETPNDLAGYAAEIRLLRELAGKKPIDTDMEIS